MVDLKSPAMLEVQHLGVHFETPDGRLDAVRDLSFSLSKGQTFGIVGESGSGKSQSMLAILGLLAAGGHATGAAHFEGRDLLRLAPHELNRIRGNRIAMIFQDPMTSLNPYLTIERQMTEVLEVQKNATPRAARSRAQTMLEAVQIADPVRCLKGYPHQFSGGMRQRIMIAMALLCEPDLLIADEPTTALDVTVQAQIVGLLRRLQHDFGTGILMITHDLGLVAGLCDEIMVMYGGRIMEQGSAQALFDGPSHPYTLALLNAAPRLHGEQDALIAIPGAPPNLANMPPGCPFAPRCPLADTRCNLAPELVGESHQRACHRPSAEVSIQGIQAAQPTQPTQLIQPQLIGTLEGIDALNIPLLRVRDLQVGFPVRRGDWPWSPGVTLRAVRGVSFDLQAGETLGVVGESGCGKSTLARALLNLVPFQAESLRWFDQELAPKSAVAANAGITAGLTAALTSDATASSQAWLEVRRQVQMVFQDPLASLDPRMNILQILSEPLRTHEPGLTAADRLDRVCALIERVGLDRHQLDRYPHEFSGGQCQRIGIARALILRPRVIVCDEPVSALDVSIQAQIINLLRDLQQEFGLALIFIAHDLTVIRHVSQRVLVMYLGQVVETGTRAALFDNPQHPYTRALLASVPVPDPKIERHRASTALVGELPSPLDPPSGCAFRTRCPIAQDQCAQSSPVLALKGRPQGSGQTQAACWLA